MIAELDRLYQQIGYRSYKAEPEQIKIYYKFYQEGFLVCLVIDSTKGFQITPQQHEALNERVMNLFYHPEGILPGFPEGLPVYHVERLTLVVGNQTEETRELVRKCNNIWGILPEDRKLLIYENQPGDMFGLRKVLEDFLKQENACQRQNNWAPTKNWKQFPVITAGIVTANIIVFLVMYFMSGRYLDGIYVVMHGGVFPPYVIERGEWWRILTAMFIHFDISHLLNNMIIFCCVGSILEKAVGHLKYLSVYLLSGIFGGLLSLFMMVREGSYAVSAGASGAVFGMIGGLLWVVLIHRGRYSGLTSRGVLFMILLSLYYGFSSAGVDNWAHIGGMIAGFVLTAVLYRRNSQKD